ncbi:hypothetical protein JX265_008160 [Neoarthrinium moseri]|uniref:Coenzyme Q-binding protein COQ10 START domain-containing protein n=1 Tax=Neoarthrinium moseri TaxID=1658444 RepID=A0A9P9WIG1_9PEZI|nr:hypothetical protein JX266_002888 [Neoarthrinium moseri]KAI1865113.1 hypothetical protein JX265_008160 [Neoarthrinium moseri]
MAAHVQPNQPPSFVAPISTPAYGDGGWASIVFSTTIAASPVACLEIMLDPTTYPVWNKWVPRVTIDRAASTPVSGVLPPPLSHIAAKQDQLLPGTRFHFEVHMSPESASFNKTELEVTVLEQFDRDGRKGLRVVWKTPGSPWYLRAERVQEFLESADGGCEYTSYETFFGPVTWLVKLLVGKQLQGGLTLWKDGLKAEAEARTQSATKL